MIEKTLQLGKEKKLTSLKRRVVKTCVTSLIVIGALGVGYYLTHSYKVDQEKTVKKIERNIRQKQTQLSELERKFNIYNDSFFIYADIYKELQRGRYSLDVNRARAAMNILRKRHRISGVSVNISAQQLLGERVNERDGFQPIYREVDLGFTALSDLHIYAVIESIETVFPGFLRVKKLNIKKEKDLDREVIERVAAGELASLARAEVKLLWIGIEEVENEDL